MKTNVRPTFSVVQFSLVNVKGKCENEHSHRYIETTNISVNDWMGRETDRVFLSYK